LVQYSVLQRFNLMGRHTLIKKKIKFSSFIRKFRVEQLQSHWLTASSYMGKYLRISSYIRKPFLIYDFATAPLWISFYMRKIRFSFLSVHTCTILDSWEFQKMNFGKVISPHANFVSPLLKTYKLSLHSTKFYVQNFAKLQSRRFSQGNFPVVKFGFGHKKPNSWTYNFAEVSGHDLESSQTWGFCMVL
jgi:hypothetical protein